MFVESSNLCQSMPVREMDLVHYLRKSGGIHVDHRVTCRVFHYKPWAESKSGVGT